jgi:hypothetical protein
MPAPTVDRTPVLLPRLAQTVNARTDCRHYSCTNSDPVSRANAHNHCPPNSCTDSSIQCSESVLSTLLLYRLRPRLEPTPAPTVDPTPIPTHTPSRDPTPAPTVDPTHAPTVDPTPVRLLPRVPIQWSLLCTRSHGHPIYKNICAHLSIGGTTKRDPFVQPTLSTTNAGSVKEDVGTR